MWVQINSKAKLYILSGFIVSIVSMFLFWSYNTIGGGAFFIGCVAYLLGISLLSRAPIDGLIGKWLIPAYALLWTLMDWYFLNLAWTRLGQQAGEGLDAVMLVGLAQVIGIGLCFVPRVQRVLRYHLAYALILFWPVAIIYLLTVK